MYDTVFRPYDSSDLADCLAIFDGNVPGFFAPQERAEFDAHLQTVDASHTPYLVVSQGNTIAACGGLTIESATRRASLSWGMVDRRLHGQGLGSQLMRARLTFARSIPYLAEVVLSTSQHTHRFYEGFGFTVLKVTPAGIGPGLDRWDMVLHL